MISNLELVRIEEMILNSLQLKMTPQDIVYRVSGIFNQPEEKILRIVKELKLATRYNTEDKKKCENLLFDFCVEQIQPTKHIYMFSLLGFQRKGECEKRFINHYGKLITVYTVEKDIDIFNKILQQFKNNELHNQIKIHQTNITAKKYFALKETPKFDIVWLDICNTIDPETIKLLKNKITDRAIIAITQCQIASVYPKTAQKFPLFESKEWTKVYETYTYNQMHFDIYKNF